MYPWPDFSPQDRQSLERSAATSACPRHSGSGDPLGSIPRGFFHSTGLCVFLFLGPYRSAYGRVVRDVCKDVGWIHGDPLGRHFHPRGSFHSWSITFFCSRKNFLSWSFTSSFKRNLPFLEPPEAQGAPGLGKTCILAMQTHQLWLLSLTSSHNFGNCWEPEVELPS